MIAPSEKHLEQWIVDNPRLVYETIAEPEEHWDGNAYFLKRIVKQQCRLPSGICDLVAVTWGYADTAVSAVEIKKGAIKSDTVAQCLRYMRDLREIFLQARHPGINSPIYTGYEYKPYGIAEHLLGHSAEIGGMVIGHSVSDPNMLVACEASGIQVLTYEWDGSRYTFESHGDEKRIDNQEHYSNFAYGAIGDAIREVMKERYERQQRQNQEGGAE